jgi:5-(carboxyamino)imidazole ribonucleotide synthase
MTVGVLGGGQLGRMLGLAGIPLGLRFRFLDPGGDGAPAAAVGRVVEGDYADPEAVDRFAHGLDVVTWEFENVPVETARRLAERVPVFPPPEALEAAQDRWVEKETFRALGIPVAPTRPVSTRGELDAAVVELGLPAVLKTRRFGYDGKGQVVIRSAAGIDEAWEALGGRPLVLEAFVDFSRELSLVVARSVSGETRAWPLSENVHRRGILRTSRVPAASAARQAEAEAHGVALLDHLGYVGVLAVEFFETGAGLVANEMAPRVHNSGHWSQDGALTSQFENHVRAILDLPLGPTGLRGGVGGGASGGDSSGGGSSGGGISGGGISGGGTGAAAMVNFIGGVPPRAAALGTAGEQAESGVVRALHLYDKAPRPGRKVGHLNLWGADPEAVDRALAEALALAEGAGEG